MSESRWNGRERSKRDLSKLNKNQKRDGRQPSSTRNETHERLGNVSDISKELARVNLESYIGKHILKDFGGTTTLGTTYVGTITKLWKDKDDGTPFLQVTYEDGDQEEFVEEDIELLDELIEEYDLRESPTKFVFDKNLICDICNKGDGYKGKTMQKCSECGVAVHEDCYSINSYAFLGGRKWKQWKCHACASVGHTFSAIRQSNSHIEQVTVRKRPVHCALCNFHDGHHAMHPFYNTHGSKGLPYLSVNSQEEGVQWVHTFCALALSTHVECHLLIFGCDNEGGYELVNQSNNDDNSSIYSDEELEERSHLDFNYRKADHTLVSTTIHRFVFNLETLEHKGTKKRCQDYTCIVCDTNSHHSQMIAVKCGNKKHNCRKAFHIGCAKWGNTNAMVFETENPFRWYVCCSEGCKSRFRKKLSDNDFSEVDNSLEARRKTENVGKQNIDEDFVSRDDEYEEQERSNEDNAQGSPTKKSRKCNSQSKIQIDSLISNSERNEIREKERAELCLKMEIDLKARLAVKSCNSIRHVDKHFDECKSHFQNQQLRKTTFDLCWEKSKAALERIVENKKREIESSLRRSEKPQKAKKKNNENQWNHLFVNRGFQMGDPRSRLDNTSSE